MVMERKPRKLRAVRSHFSSQSFESIYDYGIISGHRSTKRGGSRKSESMTSHNKRVFKLCSVYSTELSDSRDSGCLPSWPFLHCPYFISDLFLKS